MERIILHSDLNNFYASVECIKNPELKNKYVAVCGSQEDRHGIVLAKNQPAKEMGVKTGDVIWEAKQKCPDLVIVPPDFDSYVKYSKVVREIYYSYTDLVEPFGMDECWLDVSGSTSLFGSGEEIAHKIRRQVKKETGLTVSVGVSFNKIFAKLGSDIKKPDAVTCIGKSTFKEQIWGLPVSELLGVGRATGKKLSSRYIRTIGDLAKCPPDSLKRMLGINGITLWRYANGMDYSKVSPFGYTPPIKSIGHGITCTEDLTDSHQVWCLILELTKDISKKLRKNGLMCEGVAISVKDNSLSTCMFQKKLDFVTHNTMDIAKEIFSLFESNYNWKKPVRAVSVRAIYIVTDNVPKQLSFSNDSRLREKTDKAERTMEMLNERFGKNTVNYACLMQGLKLPENQGCSLTIPHGFMIN